MAARRRGGRSTGRGRSTSRPFAADIITLDHAIDVFALLGGPRNGDLEGLSPHRLAILPATTHTAVFLQTELLVDLVGQFLAGEAPRTMMAQ